MHRFHCEGVVEACPPYGNVRKICSCSAAGYQACKDSSDGEFNYWQSSVAAVAECPRGAIWRRRRRRKRRRRRRIEKPIWETEVNHIESRNKYGK